MQELFLIYIIDIGILYLNVVSCKDRKYCENGCIIP